MSFSVSLPDEVAARLAAEAAKRDITPDQLATELIAARLSGSQDTKAGHRVRFAAIGASTSERTAAQDEQMLAEAFGR